MIQSFHRFLIDNLTSEGNTYPQNPWLVPQPGGINNSTADPAPAPITQLVGVDAKNVILCTNCHALREKEQMLHVVDLAYPRKVCRHVVDFIIAYNISCFMSSLHPTTPLTAPTSLPSSVHPSSDTPPTARPVRNAINNSRFSSPDGLSLPKTCHLYWLLTLPCILQRR